MKEVILKIRVDKDGKVHAEPIGTAGPECLELMKVIENIKGFKCEETIIHDDMKNFDAHIVDNRQVGQ